MNLGAVALEVTATTKMVVYYLQCYFMDSCDMDSVIAAVRDLGLNISQITALYGL